MNRTLSHYKQYRFCALSRKSPEGVLKRRKYHKAKLEPSYQDKILSNHSDVSIMTANNTESLGNYSSSETRSVFYCPMSPHFIWDLNHTTPLKIVLAVTAIACPVIILLNLLVIIAVTSRRELKRQNSNILFSRLAVADLLVGAVSMPLTITLDALVLQRILSDDVICTIDIISEFVLYTVYNVSFLHLLLIAWDRYVAVVKWMKYKVTVTQDRVKKYVIVAWLLALLASVPPVVMQAVGARRELTFIVHVVFCMFWVACFLFIAYFNIRVYLEVRKRKLAQFPFVSTMAQANLETKIAYTIFWLTLFAGISGFPAVPIHLFSGRWPFLGESSIFRWTETVRQLNSLVNPMLYFYRNRRLRKTALELLRCRKPQRIQPETLSVRRAGRRRYSVASLDFEELQIRQSRPYFVKSQSCGTVMCSETVRRGPSATVNERPTSVPSKTANADMVLTQQYNKLVVTVQVENATGKKRIQQNNESPKGKTELKSSRHYGVGKIARSTSLNENSFITLTNCHRNATKWNFKRSRSLPILSINLDTLDNKLNVAELTIKKQLAWNNYEDTKL